MRIQDDGDGGSKPPPGARFGYWDIGPMDLVTPHDHGAFGMSIPIQIRAGIPIEI